MKLQSHKDAESLFGAPDRPFRLRFTDGAEEMDVLWGRQVLEAVPLFAGARQGDALRVARDYALQTGCYLIKARKEDEPERTLRILAELAEPDAGPLVRLREWIPHSLGGKEYRELSLDDLKQATREGGVSVDGPLVLDRSDCAGLLAKLEKTLAFRQADKHSFVTPVRDRPSALAELAS